LHLSDRKERADVIWEQFEATAPEMAALGRMQLEQSGVAIIGTIRKDGYPRISFVEPCFLDGVLYFGMMWQSRKALDLLQDPRIVVHNTICTSTGDEVEFSLRGRVIDIRDLEVRRKYVSERTYWQEPYFHLFSLDIESASLIEYGHGEQSVRVWPLGREFKRPYG
jgi:Pyridoxamine 5'-phosphate oxidase